MSNYTQVSVSPQARDELRRFQALAGGQVGARLTMTDALALAVAIATTHLSDVARTAQELGIPEPKE